MESEEYEQIPWANLVAEATPTVDRRLYVVGGIVAAVVAVFLITRVSAQTNPPPIPTVATPVAVDAQPPGNETEPFVPTPETAPVAITEADLMAAVEPAMGIAEPLVFTLAEWFVTDFFTRDGSTATIQSLDALLSPDISAELPHHQYEGPDQFVEWAKVFAVSSTADGHEVSVAFRTVHATEDGFVRDPVGAVLVEFRQGGEGWVVDDLPMMIELPSVGDDDR